MIVKKENQGWFIEASTSNEEVCLEYLLEALNDKYAKPIPVESNEEE